jgi:ferredoxin-NADP reductase
MALSKPAVHAPFAPASHGFHPLRVARVIHETAATCTFVLEIPEELAPQFTYESGQFCTFRVPVGDEPLVRCYSMSSSPEVDSEFRVTVKRVAGGAVSNWMNDHLVAGETVEVARPAGFFRLGSTAGNFVAFGAGSGITPVFSLLKTALATTERQVRLVYANRDRESIIFGAEIEALSAEHPSRFDLVHHLDVEHGFIGSDTVRMVSDDAEDTQYFVCGPDPFMDIVEATLLADGVESERIHIERFTPIQLPRERDPTLGSDTTTRVTIDLDGRTETTDHHPGTTILQTARQMGMSPPFSCEAGSCATCMAKLLEGTATMFTNNALTADEVDEGWILTCQSLPTSPLVHVAYGYGD